jgi:hypothetical protein
MPTLARRVQVLFDPDEYARLEAEARQRHRSVGSIVRESVRRTLAQQTPRRQAALARLLDRADAVPSAQVGDWQAVKDGFERDSLSAIS